MKYTTLSSGAAVVCLAFSSRLDGVTSFQVSVPTNNKKRAKTITPCHVSKDKNIDVDYFNPSKNMDMEHVHDCADHFGKCSIQELEEMRSGMQ